MKVLHSKCIDGAIVNVERVKPKSHECVVTIDGCIVGTYPNSKSALAEVQELKRACS